MKSDTTEKLSGLQIYKTLKFQEHCRGNQKSIFNRLIPRMNDCQGMQALKQQAQNLCIAA